MAHTAKISEYYENTDTGMGRAFIEIIDDLDPGKTIATLVVHDKIENMDARIQEDIVKAIKQLRTETLATPTKETYHVADDDTIT